MIVYLAASNF